MNRTEAVRQQKVILGKVQSSSYDDAFLARGLLREIKDRSSQSVKKSLGEVGLSLQRFAQEVDLSHPGLRTIFDGQLVSEEKGSFSQDALDILNLVTGDAELSDVVVDNLKKVVRKNAYYKRFKGRRTLDAPSRTLVYVRFLDEEGRKIARAQKQRQSINMRLYRERHGYFESLPDTLDGFSFQSDVYEMERDVLTRRFKHFNKFGLRSMAAQIKLGLDKLKNYETYCGFNPVSLTTASLVLARMHGFVDLGLDLAIEGFELGMEEEWAKFAPRLYPLHDLWNQASKAIQMMVDSLEKFPPLGLHAAFDHYWVLLPTVGCGDEEELQFDVRLLESQKIIGALVGEKDGKSYFVNYWV